MNPNQRERLLEKAMRWTRVRTRAGEYVKLFGWSRLVLPGNAHATRATLDALRVFSHSTRAELQVDCYPPRTRPIADVSIEEFRTALGTPNQFDSDIGSTRVRSKDARVSLLFEWASGAAVPRTVLTGTVHEEWLDSPRNADALREFAESFADAVTAEYVLASHISDEASKLPDGAHYETRPGAGIPYVPWLLVLGPAYVEIVGRDGVEGVAPAVVRPVGRCLSLRTSDDPLLYGTPLALEREQKVRRALGNGLFVDSSKAQQKRIGPAYASEYVFGPPRSTLVLGDRVSDGSLDDSRLDSPSKKRI